MNMASRSYLDSPLGLIEISGDETGITSVLFENKSGVSSLNEAQPHEMNAHVKRCRDQLLEYFDGKRQQFDVELSLKGTDFQKTVWRELIKIPFGKTISYAGLSQKLGNQAAIRAAASANGKNTINIIIPCHRVIGSNGSLTGYGGELWRKQWLLEFEEGNRQLSLF
jgi:methylated-DNA-[protein]-cysteine S-methyltransferase